MTVDMRVVLDIFPVETGDRTMQARMYALRFTNADGYLGWYYEIIRCAHGLDGHIGGPYATRDNALARVQAHLDMVKRR